MALILRKLVEGYYYLNYELSDPRTNNLFLIETPFTVLAIIGAYFYFVFKIGPEFMKNRPAFNLDKIMIVYNIIQIVVCLYLVVQSIRLAYGRDYNLLCQPIDYSNDPVAVQIAHNVWVYFFLKVIDLLDTVFFVLRKKQNQVTFLHVYHHSGMVSLGWGGTKYLAGGHSIFVGTINCVVHIVMYGYYLITALKPDYKKHIWWKKYITQMQMIQFLMLVLHFAVILFQPNCGYPKFTAALFIPQNLFMLVLFGDFYRKAYLSKKDTKHK